jgi:hypothetical protein
MVDETHRAVCVCVCVRVRVCVCRVQNVVETFLTASSSKVVAAALTYPLHVMKTCMQVLSLSLFSSLVCQTLRCPRPSPLDRANEASR